MHSNRVLAVFVAVLGVGLIPVVNAEVTISHAKARQSTAPMGAAYMTIQSDQDDRLIAADCACSTKTEIHESKVDENGVMQMRELVDGLEISSHPAELKPGGDHVMFMGLTQPLNVGDTIQLTLDFEKAGRKTIEVPVVSHDALGQSMDKTMHEDHEHEDHEHEDHEHEDHEHEDHEHEDHEHEKHEHEKHEHEKHEHEDHEHEKHGHEKHEH